MNASEMTFGIEIECFLPSSVIRREGIRIGGYHHGIQIPGLPAGWTAEGDCSLRTNKRGYVAVEICSPVLRGAEGIQQLRDVIAKLKEWNFHTNPTCGQHIHVGAGLDRNPVALRNLICLAARFERALLGLTGTKSRAHNHYAEPMSEAYARVQNATTLDDFRPVANKYRSLNISPLWQSKRTVEFRVFQGTTNVVKMITNIQVCLGLIENAYAIRRKPKFSCSNYRHQTARGLWYRMARNFNWYSEKSMGDTRYGLLTPDALDEMKAEAERLTAKYDVDDRVEQHRALRPVVDPRRGPEAYGPHPE
jgi:hypothetical protein